MRSLVRFVVVSLTLGSCGRGSSPTEAKRDLARRMAETLAYEAYPMWAVRPANAGRCPSLAELREFVDRDPVDPWGRRFRVRCDHPPAGAAIAVWSAGPDGEDGTGDDIVPGPL